MRFILFFFFIFFAIQDSYCQTSDLKNHKEEIHKIKTDGINFKMTGDSEFDSIVKLSLETLWDVSNYEIIESSDINDLKPEDFMLAHLSVSVNDNFGERSDSKLAIIPQSSLDSTAYQILVGTMMWCRTNIYGGNTIAQNDAHSIPFAIRAMNDCIKMIIENPKIKSIKDIHKSINIENSSRTKGKTILFIEGASTKYILFDEFDKAGIKYKLVKLSEYQDMSNDDLSSFVLAAFGGNTSVTFSLHDPVSKDLLYYKHYYLGFLTAKRMSLIQKHY
jgi:hypothetical protein